MNSKTNITEEILGLSLCRRVFISALANKFTLIVEEFNSLQGIYSFEFEGIETELHAHPAIEIMIAKNGTFSLETEVENYSQLKLAIVSSNMKHKLSGADCILKISMIEHHNHFVLDNLKSHKIELINGCFLLKVLNNEVLIINEIVQSIKNIEGPTEYDPRISKLINYLNQNDLEYDSVIETLKGITSLSESRLSHLFKSNIGISLKKYLIWTKLKSTIKDHLNSKDDLFSSLIKSGFYDQPHFSKSFKSMLGVKPSKAYNSRTLQV